MFNPFPVLSHASTSISTPNTGGGPGQTAGGGRTVILETPKFRGNDGFSNSDNTCPSSVFGLLPLEVGSSSLVEGFPSPGHRHQCERRTKVHNPRCLVDYVCPSRYPMERFPLEQASTMHGDLTLASSLGTIICTPYLPQIKSHQAFLWVVYISE